MHVPINSFRFFGMELDIYKHDCNPSEHTDLQNYCEDGYLEIFLTITSENNFINPNEYRVLIVSPTDGRRLFAKEGNLFVLTLAPLERFTGLHHDVNYDFQDGCTTGADFLNILTNLPNTKERCETLVIRHTKGVMIPESMLLN